jgi:hypothetical protein
MVCIEDSGNALRGSRRGIKRRNISRRDAIKETRGDWVGEESAGLRGVGRFAQGFVKWRGWNKVRAGDVVQR